jgi:thiol-disulfide isomerase/thioredoxin
MQHFLVALLLVLPMMASAGDRELARSVDDALAHAQREHVPVFIDFQAQWCYSCYFMATHVLTGPQWQALEKRMRVIEVDADSPDGASWMKKLSVKALPSYVVLKADGGELGRITAEQPRAKFYPVLERILAGGDSLDALKAKARHGSASAAAEVLAGYEARNEIQAGLDWYATLADAQRKAAATDPKVGFALSRLQMEKASKAKDVQGCVDAAQRALAADAGCERMYVLEQLVECSEKLADSARTPVLAAQRPALDALLAKQVFVDPPQCADQRTAVLVAADLAKAIGDKAVETAVLSRGIDNARQRLGGNYTQDRNLADNLRVYLTRAERTAELDALMPKLMAAYPDDYVYAYRYGRSLLERGKPAEALPYLEHAADKTFGANRLAVATLRVKALLALKRRADAEKVVADALEANGPWFPEAAEKLKAALKG